MAPINFDNAYINFSIYSNYLVHAINTQLLQCLYSDLFQLNILIHTEIMFYEKSMIDNVSNAL